MSLVEKQSEQPKKQQLTIRDHLQSDAMIERLRLTLPKHMTPERMASIALTALMRTPKLNECTQASFFKCLLDLSQWGLEPDGRRAHLIPYRNNQTNTYEAQLIIDYKGLVELAYRSNVVSTIHADVVRDGDLFRYSLGEVQEHVPHFLRNDSGKPDKEGEVFAVYCIVRMKDGATKTEVLSRKEVEAIRARSKAGRNGPWVSDWPEMAKKTAFRRVSKWLPLSAEIRDVMDRDDDKLEPIEQRRQSMDADQLAGLLEDSGSGEEVVASPA